MAVKFGYVFGIEGEGNTAGQKRCQQLGLFSRTFPIIAYFARYEHKYESGGDNAGENSKDEEQPAAEAGP